MYLEGCTRAQIAEEVGCSERTISSDLKALADEWEKKVHQSYTKHMKSELGRLYKIEQEAWREWRKSIDRVEEEVIEGENSRGSYKSVRRKKVLGDTAYLDRVQKAIAERAKLLGLEKIANENIEIDASVTLPKEIFSPNYFSGEEE